MSFLSPALLIGLLAAAIPPILHLLLRRKAKVVRFPALEFILRSHKKTARRFRMKQILLMVVRSLLLGAFAFALARPYVQHGQAPAAVAGVRGGTTVFVVDASWPMAYQLAGESLLDKARFKAGELLGQISGQAAVVIAGDEVEVPVGEPTSDLSASRRALEDLVPGNRHGRLSEAVARAYELLNDAPAEGGRRVVVLTTAAGAASPLPQPPPATGGNGIELVPVDVAEGAPVPNRAVLDVRLRPAPEVGADTWRVDARVGNFSDDPVERLPIHLEVDGAVKVRGFVSLDGGSEATKTFYTRVEAKEAIPAAVVLEPDALKSDDRRDFWLQPAPSIRVLAVNGDPRPTPYQDELFYFERALAPNTAAGARVKMTITGVDTLERHDLADYDVVVLANAGDLPRARVRDLETFVRGGGGLLITVGDQMEPARSTEQLGELLPRRLRDIRAAGDAAASREGGDRQLARLSVFERAHPILRPFPDPAGTSLGRVRVATYMLLDPAPDAGGEVVLALDDGAPFLLTKTLDQGRVALLTGTLDRDWGDLPIRPDFLPLLQQTLRYLTRAAEIDTTPVLVGRPAPIPVQDQRVRRVQVTTPQGQLHLVERPQDEQSPWTFAATDAPGHYRIAPDPPLPGLMALPGFAVALDPTGADLRGPSTPEALAAADGDKVRAAIGATKRTELWHAALAGLFFLLLAEGSLLFKRRREVETA